MARFFIEKFLTDPANRKYIEAAKIQAFIPCGGFKDTVNHTNVQQFVKLFSELIFIVEGANVFFDDAARRFIATKTNIKQIKDTTANKGGVFSSSIAEVLTAFLLGDKYESDLLNDTTTRWALTKDVLEAVCRYGAMETKLLLRLHDRDPEIPLFELSEKTSEQIFSLQGRLEKNYDRILADRELVKKVLAHYIPPILMEKQGDDRILALLSTEQLQPYRDAIITKKLASMAIYRFGEEWDAYLQQIENNFEAVLHSIFAE